MTFISPYQLHSGGYISSVYSFSHILLFVIPWTAALQASLLFINSWSLLKLMSIELVTPSNHLIFCRPLLLPPSVFPTSWSFQMSHFFVSGSQSIGASASVSSVQSLSHVRFCVIPWTAALQASLSTTNCQSLLKLMPKVVEISLRILI